jgi:hypothetical protein
MTMFDDMKIAPGDVVKMTVMEAVWRSKDGETVMRTKYKATKGRQFVFLLLDVEEIKNPVDAGEALRQLGWRLMTPEELQAEGLVEA